MKSIIKLFLAFAKIGAVTFGGGYAMLPILQRDIVNKHNWATEEELMDYFAIGQCTPGVIAVNTATFIGHKNKGIAGAVAATLGVITPSIIIISIIAAFVRNFQDILFVQYAFNGIRVCVCVLILNSITKLAKSALIDKWAIVIFCIVFTISILFNISSAILVLFAGLSGYLIKKFIKKEDK